MKKALIIGGGFAGCASAHQLALQGGWDVTLVEAAPILGAGVRTMWYGGHPHTFGPRHFLTKDERLFVFLNKYLPLRRLKHVFQTYVEQDQEFYNFPIHSDDIKRMPDSEKIHQEMAAASMEGRKHNIEDYWLGNVGPTLYEKFAKNYNKKMWQVDDNSVLDDGVANWASKGNLVYTGNKAAFHDDYISAYPIAATGYDSYFDLSTAEAKVHLSTRIEEYDMPGKRMKWHGEWHTFDVIISTISPDIIFNRQFGELRYVGLDFMPLVLPMEFCFPEDVYFLYYSGQEKHKRVVEYKKFTGHKSPTTLIGIEIPSLNGKFYPMPIKAERAKAQQYLDLLPNNTFSIGRAGSYRYIDIDDCIEQAMAVAANLR